MVLSHATSLRGLPPVAAPDLSGQRRYWHTLTQAGDATYSYGGSDTSLNPALSTDYGGVWEFDGTAKSWSLRDVIGETTVTARGRIRVDSMVRKSAHCAVWTGESLLAYGGAGYLSVTTNRGLKTNLIEFRPLPNRSLFQTMLSRNVSLTGADASGWPPLRYLMSCIWDSHRRSMIVFGGTLDSDPLFGDWGTSVGTSDRRYHPNQTDELWEYHFDSNTWTNLTASAKMNSLSSPSARAYHTAVWESTTDTMYVYGGVEYSRTTQAGETFRNDVWAYIRGANMWEQLVATMPTARFGHMAAATGTSMYVYGGVLEGFVLGANDCLWEFSYASKSWSQLGNSNSCFVHSASLFGSATFDGCRNKVLFYGFQDNFGRGDFFFQYGLPAPGS
ncbi:gefF [Symbiodinium sp. CCMP2456]|nr:gefF [Symbiodinium sp. CCMP2456]